MGADAGCIAGPMFDSRSAIGGDWIGGCPPAPEDGPDAPLLGSTLDWSPIDEGPSLIGLADDPLSERPPPKSISDPPVEPAVGALATGDVPLVVTPPPPAPPRGCGPADAGRGTLGDAGRVAGDPEGGALGGDGAGVHPALTTSPFRGPSRAGEGSACVGGASGDHPALTTSPVLVGALTSPVLVSAGPAAFIPPSVRPGGDHSVLITSPLRCPNVEIRSSRSLPAWFFDPASSDSSNGANGTPGAPPRPTASWLTVSKFSKYSRLTKDCTAAVGSWSFSAASLRILSMSA